MYNSVYLFVMYVDTLDEIMCRLPIAARIGRYPPKLRLLYYYIELMMSLSILNWSDPALLVTYTPNMILYTI